MLAALVAMAVSGALGPEQIVALLEEEKYGEALREAKKAAELEPSSGPARYAYGLVLRSVYRPADAAAELERAHRLAPDDAAIAVELGWAMCDLGQLDRARAIAADAVKKWPAEAAELQAWLDREARMRGGAKAEFPAGSAPAFAARVMDKLARRQIKEVLREDVDRALLDRWAADSGSPSATGTDEVVSGFARGIEESIEKRGPGARLHGYQVSAEAAERAGRTYVGVTLLIESRSTPGEIAMFEKGIADPSLPVPMDPTMAATLRALDPADRKLSLDAMRGRATLDELPLEFELSGGKGSWKIADVVEPESGLRLSRLVEISRKLMRQGVIQPPEPKRRRDRAYDLGHAIGRVIGPLLVILLAIALWRRSRRRRT